MFEPLLAIDKDLAGGESLANLCDGIANCYVSKDEDGPHHEVPLRMQILCCCSCFRQFATLEVLSEATSKLDDAANAFSMMINVSSV